MFRQAVSFIERLLHWHRGNEVLSPTGAERRVWIRHPAKAPTACQPAHEPEGHRHSARVLDISRGGIRVGTDHEFEPGTLLLVELPGSVDEELALALAYVIHVSPLTGGEWALGCSFAAELDDGDMERFGVPRVKSTPPDKRGWVRFPCDLAASYRLVEGEQEGTARVIDLSPSGVGLSVPGPVEVGSLLQLAIHGPTPENALSMLACVVRAVRKGDQHFLGCNFIRELTDAELDACCRAGVQSR